ncbi:hypothetical protein CLOHYLEM_04625 [[Clostridium] hylemonae DSM 15053]|uniref:Uncharacterized protein n=1 Tax=[Clostridium] hylemonae DSM 15053 TaxID=553973 RepID=C0BXT8_9FIRM|nr:hypothetical protein CLOHYLEM_04625 [[Clostridium] hylemonae DSM 15053]
MIIICLSSKARIWIILGTCMYHYNQIFKKWKPLFSLILCESKCNNRNCRRFSN